MESSLHVVGARLPVLRPAQPPAARDLNAPADPVQQIHPGRCVLHAEPAALHLSHPRQHPALVFIPLGGVPASSAAGSAWTHLRRRPGGAAGTSAGAFLAMKVPAAGGDVFQRRRPRLPAAGRRRAQILLHPHRH